MTALSQDNADAAYRALSNRTRRDILRRALINQHSISALAETYSMTFAAVQKHIAVLERAGLLTKRRLGREVLVKGDPDALLSFAAMLVELSHGLDERASAPKDQTSQVKAGDLGG